MNGKEHFKISNPGIVIFGFIFAFLFGAVACQHSVFTYNGRIVKPENRIPLKEGGPHKSEWKTEDLTLTYVYHRQGRTLDISGNVTFAGSLEYNFRDFSDFFLTIYFTDAAGKINGEHTLTSSGMMQPIEQLPFNERVTLPSGAANMIFGYRGRAVDQGSEGGDGAFGSQGGTTGWEFWKTPTR